MWVCPALRSCSGPLLLLLPTPTPSPLSPCPLPSPKQGISRTFLLLLSRLRFSVASWGHIPPLLLALRLLDAPALQLSPGSVRVRDLPAAGITQISAALVGGVTFLPELRIRR